MLQTCARSDHDETRAAMLERRGAPRRRVLKGAIMKCGGHWPQMACTVLDISATGARLRVGELAIMPAKFELVIELDGLQADCEVVRRRQGEIGVRFRSPPQQGKPTRFQSISAYCRSKAE